MFWGSGGSESRLAKAGGAEPSRGMKDENYKDTSSSEHFKFRRANSCTPVVARSTLRSENVTNSSGSDHFGKSEAQFWVKLLKHPMFGPFFGVEASFYVAGTQWSLHLVKSVSDVWVLRQFQHDSRRGIFEKRICKRIKKMHVAWQAHQAQYKRHLHLVVRRSGRWLPEGCILEHQIFRFC